MARSWAQALWEGLSRFRRLRTLKPLVRKAAPLLSILLGFGLVLVALTEARSVRTVGSLLEFAPPGETAFEVSTTGSPPYALELAAESCSLEVFPLDLAGFALYEQNGTLPAEGLDCAAPNGTFSGLLSHIVAKNRDPNLTLLFSLEATAERFTHPYALASLPGFALVIAGLAAFALGMLQRGIGRLRDDLEAKLDQEGKRKEK